MRRPTNKKYDRAISLAVIILLSFGSSIGAAKSVALTFDDGLNPAETANAESWNDQIIRSLRAAGVEATVFPSLKHTGGDAGRALIRKWSDAGHAVGNHTSRHRSFGSPRVTLDEFTADVLEAEAAFGSLPTWKRMLRFPFLKEGDTAEKRDGMRAWMREHSYDAAPVSIDTSDWYFNQVFLKLTHERNEAQLRKLRALYVRHIVDRANYYDDLARKYVGRSPKHVLLLHVNAINAAWLPDVIKGLKARGWSIIDSSDAFADPMYRAATPALPAGESIVWSIAKVAGATGLRYPAEDSQYEEATLRAAGVVP
jgi:peptidoglycan/xylan/chitin deacetylase (PgdA/CDA1 family)